VVAGLRRFPGLAQMVAFPCGGLSYCPVDKRIGVGRLFGGKVRWQALATGEVLADGDDVLRTRPEVF